MVLTNDTNGMYEMTATSLAKRWYGKWLPRVGTKEFVRFAARSAAIAEQIAIAPIRLNASSQSAYTDGKTIYIPGIYFSEEFLTDLNSDQEEHSETSITLINGSTIHEALHILLSDCDMRAGCSHHKEASGLIDLVSFQTCLGLIEDIYIENYGNLHFPIIHGFVSDKDELIFSQNEFEERLQAVDYDGNQTSVLNLLLCRKNVALDTDEKWKRFSEFTSIIDEAKAPTLSKNDRIELAIRLWKLFEDEEVQKSVGFAPDETFRENDATDYLHKSPSKVGEARGTFSVREGLEEVEEEFNREAKLGEKFFVPSDYEEDFRENTEIKYKEVVGESGSASISKNFSAFANAFRYMNEEKHTLGRPNNQGTRIVKQRLSRILTDGKVLAYHDRKAVVRGKPKLIILLDASGSMSMRDLWSEAKEAVHGAFLSAQRAGISIAAYAHTSFVENYRDKPIVYGIAAHNMPLGPTQNIAFTSNVSDKFVGLASISLRENYDGFAIDFVSKLFPARPGTNVLLVLSDGTPSGDGYRGYLAREHVKHVVDGVRRRGTSVISLSLTEDVKSSNDEIYGSKFNVSAFDGQLEKSLQTILSAVK